MKKVVALLLFVVAILASCSKEVLDEVAPADLNDADRLVLDVQDFPFANLSEYGFFKGRMADHRPVPGVLPFAPITPLFTDYAHKKRFVWMPAGVSATYSGDHNVLNFPDGTVLIKTFYYDHVLPADEQRIIETRLLFKRNGGWEFANYVWNAEQTEATFDMTGSYTPITWTDDNGLQRTINYRIPALAECQTCHKDMGLPVPIGPKPQNLNGPFNYGDERTYAPAAKNQLQKWAEMGYLQRNFPKNIVTTVRWDDPTVDLNTRVRAYVDMNCAHCHRENSHCDYRPMRFAFHETTDPANLGICVPPDDPLLPQHTFIVARGTIGRSLLHYRLSATDEAVRMPLLGRTIVHDEGLALVTEWINSLSPPCE